VKLAWELCDLKQNVLTRLDNRRAGSRVEIGISDARRAFCPLSIEDPAFALATPGNTVLRATLEGPAAFKLPLFIGRVVIPETKSEPSSEEFGINAVDPLGYQLERALIRKVTGAIWESLVFTGVDQSLIMWELIAAALANGTIHGIVKGLLPASIVRDRTYPPTKEVALALTQMTEVINGPDFMLTPTLASDGTLATFNTYYPKLGSDLSATVKFVHAHAPYTAEGFNLSPAGDDLINRVVAVGAPQQDPLAESTVGIYPGYIAEVATSIAIYGVLEKRLQLEDVTLVPTLESHAKGEVATKAFPVNFFDLTTPAEQAESETGDGIPPAFGKDYFVGDTIAVETYLGPNEDEPNLKVTGRITDAKITENEAGQLSTKLTCAPPTAAAVATGSAITLLIPEGAA
jgi:hypothetical protein